MKKVEINDILNYQFIASLKHNDAQTHYAYIKSQANLSENNYQHELYIGDGKDTYRALTLGTSQTFYWESDTSILVPYAKTDSEKEDQKQQKTVLYRYDLNRKTFEYADTLYMGSGITVLDNGKWLLHSKLTQEGHTLYEDPANRDMYLNSLKTQDDYEIIDTIPFYSDGGTFTRGALGQAFIYDPKEKTYTRLFDKDLTVSPGSYNKDTHKVYFLAQKATGVGSFYMDAYIYDVKTESLTKVFENNNSLSIGDFFELNDTLFLLATDMRDHGINQNKDFYVLKDNQATLHLEFGRSSYNSTGSDMRLAGSSSRHIIEDVYYFVGTYQDRTILYAFDGKLKEIYNPKGSIDGWIPFKDSYYGIGLFDNKLQEIYELNLGDNTYTQVSTHNDKVLEDIYVAKPIYHSFVNNDINLDGWVLLPENYDEQGTYPAILDIHGGPKTIYNENFFHEMQVWVNKGYIVFFCNPRGGDSYNNDFMDIRGQYGGIDYEDIMNFTDFVVENYAVDPERMGVTGGSYGGFMTNWIVSHTDRFKAAATQRSISNWISFYGTSDIGYYFGPDQTDADPLDDFEKAWEQSPLKHARNIRTPLLFIHSDQDYRCPIEQGMQLYTVVKKQGVDTRFIWFKNENHGLSRGGRPKSRIKRLEEITQWMESYLK